MILPHKKKKKVFRDFFKENVANARALGFNGRCMPRVPMQKDMSMKFWKGLVMYKGKSVVKGSKQISIKSIFILGYCFPFNDEL